MPVWRLMKLRKPLGWSHVGWSSVVQSFYISYFVWHGSRRLTTYKRFWKTTCNINNNFRSIVNSGFFKKSNGIVTKNDEMQLSKLSFSSRMRRAKGFLFMSGGMRAEQAPVWGRSSLGRVDKVSLGGFTGCVLRGRRSILWTVRFEGCDFSWQEQWIRDIVDVLWYIFRSRDCLGPANVFCVAGEMNPWLLGLGVLHFSCQSNISLLPKVYRCEMIAGVAFCDNNMSVLCRESMVKICKYVNICTYVYYIWVSIYVYK